MTYFFKDNQISVLLILRGICVVTGIYVLITKMLPWERRRYLFFVEVCSVFILMSDTYYRIFNGDMSRLGWWVSRISVFVLYFMILAFLRGFNAYLMGFAVEDGGLDRVPAELMTAKWLLVAGEVLLVISQFTGLYYRFDTANRYVRSPCFVIFYLFPLAAFALEFIAILKLRGNLRRSRYTSLILFTVVPVLASIVQIFAFGYSLVTVTIVGVGLLLFVFVLADMNEAIELSRDLEIRMLREQNAEMQQLFEETAKALVNAIDAKDKYTQGHSARVAEYSMKIAEAAGKSREECRKIYYSALLHDVGKIGIPGMIINKRGTLTEKEYETIKRHPSIGGMILSSITKYPFISTGARYHHERYDGTGYPDGLAGEDIPEIGRIVAVADAYDAMTSHRSYRSIMPQSKVREELVSGSGTQFDPKFAAAMIDLIDQDKTYMMREM